MKVKTINYQKVFPLAQYVNERIGVEIELSDGDNEEIAFLNAKELVHSWAEQKSQLHDAFTLDESSQYGKAGSQFANHEQQEEAEIGVTPESILSCKELKILQTYRFIKDTSPELKRAYEMKLDQLSNPQK